MQYKLRLRWFVGLGIADAVWVLTAFKKNRDRLLTTELSRKFLAAILAHREVAPLLSDEHFSVDGTLLMAWASMKSFQPKPNATPPESGDGPNDSPLPPPATDGPASTLVMLFPLKFYETIEQASGCFLVSHAPLADLLAWHCEVLPLPWTGSGAF